MAELFTSGHVADLLLLVITLEAAWLWWTTRPRSVATTLDIAFALAPGVCLILALRAALADADWWWIAAALTASFPAHLLDLYRRRFGRPRG